MALARGSERLQPAGFHEAPTEILPSRQPAKWLQAVTTQILERPAGRARPGALPLAYLLVSRQGEPSLHRIDQLPFTLGGRNADLCLADGDEASATRLTITACPGETAEPRWRLRAAPTGRGIELGGACVYDAVVGAGLRFSLDGLRLTLTPARLAIVVRARGLGHARDRIHRLAGPRATLGRDRGSLGLPGLPPAAQCLAIEAELGSRGEAASPRLRVETLGGTLVRVNGRPRRSAQVGPCDLVELGSVQLRLHLEIGICLDARHTLPLVCPLS